MILINFKTYPSSTGEKGIQLAKICQEVAEKTKARIIISVQTADIFRLRQQVDLPIFGQHFDPLEPGRYTGWTTALALKEAGAAGVFLNHSEHQFPPNYAELKKAVEMAKNQGLKTLVFSPNLESSRIIDQFQPDYIVLEEPSLVAGEKAMVEDEQLRSLIKEFSASIKSFPFVGAGIKTKEDVLESLRLGVRGVVVASGFVLAENPQKILEDFASCFQ